jgi:signal transduction histidine kinase
MMNAKRQSLLLTVLLGSTAILLTISVLVAWSIIFTRYYMLFNRSQTQSSLGMSYWLLLAIGCVFLVGIVIFLSMFVIENIRKTLYLRQQTTFIDSVTHELKSPLASLRLCLDTMNRRELTPEMQQKFLDMMRADVMRLDTFIQHILEAGRLENDEVILHYEATHLEEIAEQIRAKLLRRYQLQPEQIHIRSELEGEEKEVLSVPIALDTILSNLLDNAVKYSPTPCDVTLLMRRDGDSLHFEVIDQGLGIPPRKLKKVFRRFYRVPRENPTGLQARGTGLGLYVVSNLTQQLGGSIAASSEGEGQGSTFSIQVPYLPMPRQETMS